MCLSYITRKEEYVFCLHKEKGKSPEVHALQYAMSVKLDASKRMEDLARLD